MSSFKDKVVVVTGASKGIGKAIARIFAKKGAKVVVNYFSDEKSAEEVLEYLKTDTEAISYKADVTDFGQVSNMIKHTVDTFGGVDILINNAGFFRDKYLLFMQEEEWDSVIDTNLKGAYNCCKAVLKEMIYNKYGRIINISSVSAVLCPPGQSNYAASKAGLISLTKSLSKEVGHAGITVNAVTPGFIETDALKTVAEHHLEDQKKMIGLKRFGKPQEVANAVLFLASDEASYINGAVLNVDGGM